MRLATVLLAHLACSSASKTTWKLTQTRGQHIPVWDLIEASLEQESSGKSTLSLDFFDEGSLVTKETFWGTPGAGSTGGSIIDPTYSFDGKLNLNLNMAVIARPLSRNVSLVVTGTSRFEFASTMYVSSRGGLLTQNDMYVVDTNTKTLTVDRTFSPISLRDAVDSATIVSYAFSLGPKVSADDGTVAAPLTPRRGRHLHESSFDASTTEAPLLGAESVEDASQPSWYVVDPANSYSDVASGGVADHALKVSLAGLATRAWGETACGGVFILYPARFPHGARSVVDFVARTLHDRPVANPSSALRKVDGDAAAVLKAFFGKTTAASRDANRTHAHVRHMTDAADSADGALRKIERVKCHKSDVACNAVRNTMKKASACKPIRDIVKGYVVWDEKAARTSLAAAFSTAGAKDAIVVSPALAKVAASYGLKQVASYVGTFNGVGDAEAALRILAAHKDTASRGVVMWLAGEGGKDRLVTAAADIAVMAGALVLPPLCVSRAPACAEERAAADVVYAHLEQTSVTFGGAADWKQSDAEFVTYTSSKLSRVEGCAHIANMAALVALPAAAKFPLVNPRVPLDDGALDKMAASRIAVAFVHAEGADSPNFPETRSYPSAWPVSLNHVWLQQAALELRYSMVSKVNTIVGGGSGAGVTYMKALPSGTFKKIGPLIDHYAIIANVSHVIMEDESEGTFVRGDTGLPSSGPNDLANRLLSMEGVIHTTGPANTFAIAQTRKHAPFPELNTIAIFSATYMLSGDVAVRDAVADVALLADLADMAHAQVYFHAAELGPHRKPQTAGTPLNPFKILIHVEPGTNATHVQDFMAGLDAQMSPHRASAFTMTEFIEMATKWPAAL